MDRKLNFLASLSVDELTHLMGAVRYWGFRVVAGDLQGVTRTRLFNYSKQFMRKHPEIGCLPHQDPSTRLSDARYQALIAKSVEFAKPSAPIEPLAPLPPEDPERADRLAHCESIVTRGWHVFIEVGKALAEIKRDSLYPKTYGTWEEYCRKRWLRSATHADRQIRASEVATLLATKGFTNLREFQLRPLTRLALDDSEVISTWTHADSVARDTQNKVVTARLVNASLAEVCPAKLPTKPANARSAKALLSSARDQVCHAHNAFLAQDENAIIVALDELLRLLCPKRPRTQAQAKLALQKDPRVARLDSDDDERKSVYLHVGWQIAGKHFLTQNTWLECYDAMASVGKCACMECQPGVDSTAQ